MNVFQDVKDFMLSMGQLRPVAAYPAIPEEAMQLFRKKLNEEEFGEMALGWDACRDARQRNLPVDIHIDALAEFADGIADLMYVIIGAAHAYGIPIEQVWQAVQDNNMSKLWTMHEIQTEKFQAGWTYSEAGTRNGVQVYAVRRQDGKVVKPPSFRDVNLRPIIEAAIKSNPTDMSTLEVGGG